MQPNKGKELPMAVLSGKKRCNDRTGPLYWLCCILVVTSSSPSLAFEPVKPACAQRTAPIHVEGGQIIGERHADGISCFKGIPFAAPPVGRLRWQPPQPVKAWPGIRQCTSWGPSCPQLSSKMLSDLGIGTSEQSSEDCLYLNVWTPELKPKKKLPVLFWIHGGGFISGSASDDFYDGRFLSSKGAVVVTTNYRLGPFGFLAHPALSAESHRNVSGNYGLLDQIAALQWVQSNISAFGGDPKRVAIFGESAGGRSVAFLMVSPLSKGLFSRAIMQSSSAYRPIQHLRESWYARPPMEQVGLGVAAKLGCETLQQLRQKTAREILEASMPRLPGMLPDSAKKEGFPFEPVVDGWILPDDPSDLFDSGKQHPVPVIAGCNSDEGTLFLRRLKMVTPNSLTQMITQLFPSDAATVTNLYPARTPEEARQALNQLSGDMNCAYPMRAVVRSTGRIKQKAWLYYFSHVRSNSLGRSLGAWHGSEIRFVFNNLDQGKSPADNIDRKISQRMSNYWVRFAATGDPNANGLLEWPDYDQLQECYLEFADEPVIKKGLRSRFCDVFQRIEQERRQHRKLEQ